MPNKKKDETTIKRPGNYITLWAENFDCDVWEDYCDAADVSTDCDHIRIWFDTQFVEGFEADYKKPHPDYDGSYHIAVRRAESNEYIEAFDDYEDAKYRFDEIVQGIQDEDTGLVAEFGDIDSIWVEDDDAEEYLCWTRD